MDNPRLPRPGQIVMLDAPDVFRFVVRHCRIVDIGDSLATLQSEDPLPYLPQGTPVLLWSFGQKRQLEGEVVDTPSADTTVVRLGSFRERRASPRYRAVFDVVLEPAGETGAEPVKGVTQNVSETGVRAWLRQRLFPGQRALATLAPPDTGAVTAILEVVHAALAPRNGLYDTRLKITSISADDQSRLRRFLHEHPASLAERDELPEALIDLR